MYASRMKHRRRSRHRLRSHPLGSVPGSIEALPGALPPTIELFAWNAERFVEHRVSSLKDIERLREGLPTVWINVDGRQSGAALEEFRQTFGIHPLALEDVQHPTERAKVETFGSVLFVVVPMPRESEGEFDTEQLSMFIGPQFVVTMQEHTGGDCFDAIRRRIRSHDGRIRDKGTPYLGFALIDEVIDRYFPIVNTLSEVVDRIEEDVVESRMAPDMYAIRNAKHSLTKVRRALWPMRDTLTALMTMEAWFDLEHRMFLRNSLDHVMRLTDMLDSDRNTASDLMELSIAIANAKLGEITMVLTMIATIFIPITFIAGVYGMNFDFMPELQWRYGYALALVLMGLTSCGFLYMFWKRGWFRDSMMFRTSSPRGVAPKQRDVPPTCIARENPRS